MQSPFKFDSETLRKIVKSALISGAGAFATYLLTNVDAIINAITESPQFAILLTGIITWLLNGIREWIKGEQSNENPE